MAIQFTKSIGIDTASTVDAIIKAYRMLGTTAHWLYSPASESFQFSVSSKCGRLFSSVPSIKDNSNNAINFPLLIGRSDRNIPNDPLNFFLSSSKVIHHHYNDELSYTPFHHCFGV